jgi:ATP-dependent DNA ligase
VRELNRDESDDILPNYVVERSARPSNGELSAWLSENPPPVYCERKYDGIRGFLFKSGPYLVLSTERGGIYTPDANPSVFGSFPELVHAPFRMILDGVYTSRRGGLHFFDLLQVDERDLRGLPLKERRDILHQVLQGTEIELPYSEAESLSDILKFRDSSFANGFSGVIIKHPTSSYGQPGSWLSLKSPDLIDCFVIDEYKTTSGSSTISWNVGLYDEEGRVVKVGDVSSIVERVKPAEIKPGSVVQLKFKELGEGGILRAPFILKVRHDKTPPECLLSQITARS